MRRLTAFAIGIIMMGFFMVILATAVYSKKEISVDAAEQVNIDILYQSTAAAAVEYYKEPTQLYS